MWHNKAMDNTKIEAMATKFSEKLCLKSIENFVGVALLIWMPHPFFKNHPDTHETPYMFQGAGMKKGG
jgi:hypothetical protein